MMCPASGDVVPRSEVVERTTWCPRCHVLVEVFFTSEPAARIKVHDS